MALRRRCQIDDGDNICAVTSMRFLFLLTLGLTMTVVSGVVYGYYSQRWGPAPDLVASGRHLETLPTQIGDWDLLRQEAMSNAVIELLSCSGYVNRQYVNRRTGETISLAITVGPAGPISVHTPEICYSSRAYSIQEPRQPVSLSDQQGDVHSFWKLTFRSNNSSADQLHVYYGWTTSGLWKAAELPRFEFGGQPILYKLQMSSLVAPVAAASSNDPCKDFLADLLQLEWNVGH
jgi:hypothetical protein